MPLQDASLLGQSARGATVLIGLQIGSRALTFAVNQILLRFLSASLLGVSARLELYLISVLTFSRESIRISLGRQSGRSPSQLRKALSETSQDSVDGGKKALNQKPLPQHQQEQNNTPRSMTPHAKHLQEVINIAYIAPVLGILLAVGIGLLYIEGTGANGSRIPFINLAICCYGLSAVLELAAEPCFAAASQEGILQVRARAETIASMSRCIVSCATAFWASRYEIQLGALPFAAGQIGYAISLNAVYWPIMSASMRDKGCGLVPRLLQFDRSNVHSSSNGSGYVLRLFSKPVLLLAGTLYGQSVLKHFLTQGDALLVSFFATYAAQGEYALASNYGSLLARMLFQPVEESSRGVFGSLLGAATTSSQPSSRPSRAKLQAARDYLNTVLRFYSLLSLGILSLGPQLAPLLLRILAGAAWAKSSAGHVLSLYCYYVPLLAFNGILEAFVAATATPSQLRAQSVWMTLFSLAFASIGYLCLQVYELGAQGLIIANSVNMAIRVMWSWSFVADYLRQQGLTIGWGDIVPRYEAIGLSLATMTALYWVSAPAAGRTHDMISPLMIAALFASSLIFLEREYLRECYYLLRPAEKEKQEKKKL